VVALAATAKTAISVSGMIRVKMVSQMLAAISFRDAMSIHSMCLFSALVINALVFLSPFFMRAVKC
jgi:hypothetical protein